jgi:hypothetical protein
VAPDGVREVRQSVSSLLDIYRERGENLAKVIANRSA